MILERPWTPHCSPDAATRSWSRTRTTSAASSKPSWPRLGWTCYARPARVRLHGREPGSSSHYARSSSRSTTPSRASSTSNNTAGTPPPECGSASCNASWPWPPPSGTTTAPASPSNDHWWPTTT